MRNADNGADDMNWLETMISAATFLLAGLVMASGLAQETIAADAVDLVTVGGLTLSLRDLALTVFLTAAASFGAAAFRYRNMKAASLNFLLGFLFGFLFAQLAIVVLGLADETMFGLAPSFALFAAKLARTVIHSDELVDAAVGALAGLIGRIGGKK